MSKTTGYKGMLRDRCPTVVDYALKWQKAKERWIDHAYNNFIKLYCDSKERYHTTRIILGIAKFYRNFEFDKSIDWDNCTEEETFYWKRVSSWVQWFVKNYAYIENMYNISKECGKDEQSIKVEIIIKWLKPLLPAPDASEEEKQVKYKYVDNLVDFLIRCFEKRILIKGICLMYFPIVIRRCLNKLDNFKNVQVAITKDCYLLDQKMSRYIY